MSKGERMIKDQKNPTCKYVVHKNMRNSHL